MPEIRQLPPSVINKIAAGEVIERPASVVKELMENSVDSGATRVDVTIEQGGSQLIRVADDGCGIHREQLLLAVASHATSKIRDADDLFRVQSLGFRGEALASIAEISELRLRSRPSEESAGCELEVIGGVHSGPTPCGCPPGTTLEVRQLFYNTPVRRKFLKTTQTEAGHVTEAFARIALAHPQLHFTLRHNTRVVHDLPPVDRWRDRLVQYFGDTMAEALIWIESCDGDIRLSGYVADPAFSRANNRMQYMFLNGRHIRDRALQHALGEAYRGLLLTGRQPIAFLRLDLPADSVDVNVHPTKLEVRFQDGGQLYSRLLGTIRNRFLTSDLTARVQAERATAGAPTASQPATGERPAPTAQDTTGRPTQPLAGSPIFDPQHLADHRQQVANWAAGTPSHGTTTTAGGTAPDSDTQQRDLNLPSAQRSMEDMAAIGNSTAMHPPHQQPSTPLGPAAVGAGHDHDGQEIATSTGGSHEQDGQTLDALASDAAIAASNHGPPALGFQIHQRYLVAEDERGMVVIDQHALHERILYEKFREKILAGRLESQRLLVPEPVTLTPAELAAVLDHREELSRLGIEVEPFGGDTVCISAYPAMLRRLGPADALRQVVELLLAGDRSPDRRDILDELLHMISCKSAVRAGDPLATEEITALLEQRHLCQDAHHCPHGRPTALLFTREELDRRFKRT